MSHSLLRMEPPSDLETPSPALGRTVATAIHQAVTDPYFTPLEKLADHLGRNPDQKGITLVQLASWAPDEFMPTCFVWDATDGGLEFSKPSSPWALDEIRRRMQVSAMKDNPRGLLYVDTFHVEGQTYWMGFLKIPLRAQNPDQMAGVFLSIDQYLREDVPRFIDDVVLRRRFPLVAFQLDDVPIRGEKDGDISLRILNRKGTVYLSRGRTFTPDKMIYAESSYYPNPIVCLQAGWDLQIFSSNAVSGRNDAGSRTRYWVILISMIVVISVVYWWAISGMSLGDT